MEMKHNGPRSNGHGEQKKDPESPPAQNRALPFPDLAAKMLIAIDGWSQSGKNTTGALVAEYLGGVLVDSGRFYRAITLACLNAGVDIFDREAVTAWCKSAIIDTRLTQEGENVEEAQVSVNGQWYSKEALKNLGLQVSAISAIPEVREIVNARLRACQAFGRVVMLGRDIGAKVFHSTPYKFFLDATEEVREQRHLKSTGSVGAIKRDIYDAHNVLFTESTVMIDTSRLEPAKVSGIILVEVFWLANQLKDDPFAP